MNVAVMQPYIFPYIAYYQLIYAADVFVILDDVNFITRGWINRNNMLLGSKAHLFSIPLEKPSQNKLIYDTKLSFLVKDREKFLKKIQLSYKKAPYFADLYPIIEEIILYEESDLTNYLHHSLEKICEYLEIDTKIVRSSKVDKDNSLQGQDRIMDICKTLGTSVYINLPGGKDLYNSQDFSAKNIELNFIETEFDKVAYKQYSQEFVNNLSFIDALMFNSKDEARDLLNRYNLTKKEI